MTVTELVRITAKPEPELMPRWVPRRAGIVNVWRYYDEVFTFHDGRLLLRGPNGSGKSKALELLLPFLFDANLRASRLSTFGTGERTMHWNLMGEGTSATTRVGYVWLEFSLSGDDSRWFTCGCRLQASTHSATVQADYFTTSQRVGTADGLLLVNEAGQPLTKAALAETLGDHGAVHGNAGDYRTAVRQTLFPGLTEQRYEALITALLQLRVPKLSQRLDPALLSTLLSRALPPLGQQEITDLAEGFERLDQQRERLMAIDVEIAATRVLADRQRTYARRVLRAVSAALISATSTMDTLTRAARTSAEEYGRVAADRTQCQRTIEQLDVLIPSCQAEIDGMTDCEAYKQGRELDQLRQQVAAERSRAISLRSDASLKRSESDSDAAQCSAAERACERRAQALRGLESETTHAAIRAGMASVQSEVGQAGADQTRSRQLLRAAVQARLSQVEAARKALGEHDRCVGRRQDAEEELEAARAAFTTARDRLRDRAVRADREAGALDGHLPRTRLRRPGCPAGRSRVRARSDRARRSHRFGRDPGHHSE